ncbi:hypothetical protein [Bradyrhizobium sp. LA7.1]|uniref:hypothetical protein n=1 Tax=unclassified Bradyrhizobium TaxID=2631580 RepID=UPI003393D4FD
MKTFRGAVMCRTSDNEFIKLRIARAYIKLLCLPEGDSRVVTLAHIGSCEVRMFDGSQDGASSASLFSIELFDHDAGSPVESRACFDIEQGAAAYQEFISR